MLAGDKPSGIVAWNYQVIAHMLLPTTVPPPVTELSHSSCCVCRQIVGKTLVSSEDHTYFSLPLRSPPPLLPRLMLCSHMEGYKLWSGDSRVWFSEQYVFSSLLILNVVQSVTWEGKQAGRHVFLACVSVTGSGSSYCIEQRQRSGINL